MGLDHLADLGADAEALPAAVLYRAVREGQLPLAEVNKDFGEPVARLAPALWRVTAIVSAFTLAHSITLSCAMLGWIELPGRLVESAIAVSVFLAALNNFLPTTAGGRGAWLAFAFGLLHGFGFAGVLGELDLGVGQLWRPLLGFNLGVEVGQLAIVAVYFPLAYWLRRTRFYRLGVLYAGSAAVCLCALFWFFQRAL